jgi:DNA replication protein DnaC
MQKIQSIVGTLKDVEVSEQEILADLLKTKEIADFVSTHDLSHEAIFAQANTFYEYQKALQQPRVNKQVEGYLLMNPYGQVEFAYRYTEAVQEVLALKRYIECLYLDETLLHASINDFKTNAQSNAVVTSLKLVQGLRRNVLPEKGLFIAGENGVGKTHLLLALAKEFASCEQKSIIVFVPELIRMLKQNVFEANALVKKLQAIPVLMLDDIGAEMQTSFSRDEVLLPILNSRMNSKKLTFFSSNFALPDLKHHFTKTQYGENEPVKATRMLERIEALSTYVGLIGENYRKQT